MTGGLGELLKWAGAYSGAPAAVERLSSALLQFRPGAPHAHRASFLNNDGSPLQLCATYGGGERKLRLIGDPGTDRAEWSRRRAAGLKALNDTLALSRAGALAALCDATFRRLVPREELPDEPAAGWMWLAAGLDGGAAMYINTHWGGDADRWRDALGWLRALLPNSDAAEALIAALRPDATLASVALEGLTPADARAKLYWRLTRKVSLARLGVPFLEHPDCGAFLARIVGDAALPLTGLVLSAGFSVAEGGITDAKLDLCAHCLPRSPQTWGAVLADSCDHFRLARFDLADALRQGDCEVAFVGFGLDQRQRRRLNLYLKPVEDARDGALTCAT